MLGGVEAGMVGWNGLVKGWRMIDQLRATTNLGCRRLKLGLGRCLLLMRIWYFEMSFLK